MDTSKHLISIFVWGYYKSGVILSNAWNLRIHPFLLYCNNINVGHDCIHIIIFFIHNIYICNYITLAGRYLKPINIASTLFYECSYSVTQFVPPWFANMFPYICSGHAFLNHSCLCSSVSDKPFWVRFRNKHVGQSCCCFFEHELPCQFPLTSQKDTLQVEQSCPHRRQVTR